MAFHSRFFFATALAAASLVSVLVPGEARAQRVEEASTAPPAPVVQATRWYGYETLLVDGAALGTMIAGGATQSTALGVAGLGLYGLGPPAVHGAHGNAGTALGDLGLRLVAPLAGAAIGYAIDYGTSDPCTSSQWLCFRGLGGFAVGTLVGYGAAVLVDAVWLAHEPARADEREVANAARVRWSPVVGVTTQGATAGVGGVF